MCKKIILNGQQFFFMKYCRTFYIETKLSVIKFVTMLEEIKKFDVEQILDKFVSILCNVMIPTKTTLLKSEFLIFKIQLVLAF